MPEAVIRGMAEWGQGERGASGYEDHGESELRLVPPRGDTPPMQPASAEKLVGNAELETQGERKTQPAGALPAGLIRDVASH